MSDMGARCGASHRRGIRRGGSERFVALGHDVAVRVGDGDARLAEHAPYDAVAGHRRRHRTAGRFGEQLKAWRPDGHPARRTGVEQLPWSISKPTARSERAEIMPVRFTRMEVD